VFAGRDLEGHGTWLGISADGGRWACLTNVREPEFAGMLPQESRGRIVADFLQGSLSAQSEAAALGPDAYAGFNACFCDGDACWFATNRGPSPAQVEPGVHVISNASLDTPWPKALRGRAVFEKALDAQRDRLGAARAAATAGAGVAVGGEAAGVHDAATAAGAAASRDDAAFADAAFADDLLCSVLGDRAPCAPVDSTGCSAALEAHLSTVHVDVFVHPEARQLYGTRTSTVILCRRDGGTHFVERDFDSAGRATTKTHAFHSQRA